MASNVQGFFFFFFFFFSLWRLGARAQSVTCCQIEEAFTPRQISRKDETEKFPHRAQGLEVRRENGLVGALAIVTVAAKGA